MLLGQKMCIRDSARAAVRAKETAYKAVMKPKEGTILTVAKGVAEKAQTLAEETDDLEEFLPKLIEEAETVLALSLIHIYWLYMEQFLQC